MDVNRIIHGDALDVLRGLPDASVDAIITDPPYGTTACAWDTVVPFEPMWALFKRIAKPNAAIVMTASQPFTSALVMSNPRMFRHEWVWDKVNPTSPLTAAHRPLMRHESVIVFGDGAGTYNPQLRKEVSTPFGVLNDSVNRQVQSATRNTARIGVGLPQSIIRVPRPNNLTGGYLHPTQKPVALMEYLIRTYTQPGDLVLDPFAGSGTTLVAARNLQRQYIGVELQAEYVETARKRLDLPYTMPMFEAVGD